MGGYIYIYIHDMYWGYIGGYIGIMEKKMETMQHLFSPLHEVKGSMEQAYIGFKV